MQVRRSYTFKEVIMWTRRDILQLLVIAAVPTLFYQFYHWKWLTLPWLPIALIGTAVAFVVGFKNNASYDRLWEARRIWGVYCKFQQNLGHNDKGLYCQSAC